MKAVKELKVGIACVFEKKPKDRKPKDFIGDSPRRMYEAIPKKVWVNDAEIKQGLYLDYRIAIKLKE